MLAGVLEMLQRSTSSDGVSQVGLVVGGLVTRLLIMDHIESESTYFL